MSANMNLESMSIDRRNVFIIRIISEFTRLKRTQRRFGSIHRQSKTLHFNSDQRLLEFWKWAIFAEWNDVIVELFSRIFLKPLWSVDGAAFKKDSVCQKGQILFFHQLLKYKDTGINIDFKVNTNEPFLKSHFLGQAHLEAKSDQLSFSFGTASFQGLFRSYTGCLFLFWTQTGHARAR